MNYIDTIAIAIQQEAEPGTPLPSDDMPLYRIYAVLMLSKGDQVTLEDVHDAWAAWTSERRPGHPDLVPFSQLTPSVRALDQPYVDAIRHLVRERRRA